MKNASSLKSSNKLDSPKTPGGISKSLLTPCRRVGLSRNWRKNGPSPFISPLAGSAEVKQEKSEDVVTKKDTRKRKQRCDEDENKSVSLLTPVSKEISDNTINSDTRTKLAENCVDLESTPTRAVADPQRKKSKTLLSSRIESTDIVDVESPKTAVFCRDAEVPSDLRDSKKENDCNEQNSDNKVAVDTPVHKSKSKESKIKLTIKIGGAKGNETKDSNTYDVDSKKIQKNTNDSKLIEPCKQKSPDNLTKECIVVIQKKIYKKDLEKLQKKAAQKEKKSQNTASQALFDSDSDDVPLNVLTNKEEKHQPKLQVVNEDDDFEENTKVNVKRLQDKTTSISGLKSDSSKKKSKQKDKDKPKYINIEPKELITQSSLDDDDEDFVMDKKRTILIRKSYDKVTKPSKAKSTGSITQKDIDELKARIEMKKKLLLAKAVTEDTEELRDLIKKWQKGCQDALMELMELMKTKFPDKQNMDYSEILQNLKIPASLVGYDEENDCFGTPTDENIILSKFND